jgi:hypothetical protein
VFDVPSNLKLKGKPLGEYTLVQGLDFGGGNDLSGKAQILLRAAIAAVLNAETFGNLYPISTADIIANTNAALASGNKNAITALAQQLDFTNNFNPCPLN